MTDAARFITERARTAEPPGRRPKDHLAGQLLRYADLAVDAYGHLHLVWYEEGYGQDEICYTKSTDGGETGRRPAISPGLGGPAIRRLPRIRELIST